MVHILDNCNNEIKTSFAKAAEGSELRSNFQELIEEFTVITPERTKENVNGRKLIYRQNINGA